MPLIINLSFLFEISIYPNCFSSIAHNKFVMANINMIRILDKSLLFLCELRRSRRVHLQLRTMCCTFGRNHSRKAKAQLIEARRRQLLGHTSLLSQNVACQDCVTGQSWKGFHTE